MITIRMAGGLEWGPQIHVLAQLLSDHLKINGTRENREIPD